MEIEHKYSFSKGEARERLGALGDYLRSRHGINIAWKDDENAHFNGKYLVVKIEGELEICDGIVKLHGKDPGMLWRKKASNYLKGKLETYLDPNTPLDSLARS